MVSKKRNNKKLESDKKDLKLSYREVLADYVSKKRALFKLTIQLNRHQNTIKVSLGAIIVSLIMLPFDKYLPLLPLMIALIWNVYQYKTNDVILKEYEQLKDKYEVLDDE
jgi:hypothetical protein